MFKFQFTGSVAFLLILALMSFASTGDDIKIQKGQLLPATPRVLDSNNGDAQVSTVFTESFTGTISEWEIKDGWHFGSDPDISGSTGNYVSSRTVDSNANDTDNWLISPSINLPASAGAFFRIKLQVREWFELESGYDFGRVRVSVDDGKTWKLVDSRSGYTDWRNVDIDLTPYSGKTIRLAFTLETDSDIAFRGWALDDIKIITRKFDTLTANIVNVNPTSNFFIYLNVEVDTSGVGIPTLNQSNFSVFENGTLQTDYFEVTPPASGSGSRIADIIFLMDNSGSMYDEQASVSNNLYNFVDSLTVRGVNYALGLCRYGQSANSGLPIIEDGGVLTSDPDYFKNEVWQRNEISGATEPGYYAITQSSSSFTFRPGSQKIFITITDETPNQGMATLAEAISACTNNSIRFFALTTPILFPTFSPITSVTNGNYFDILSPFDAILDSIATGIGNNYLVRYRSSDPNCNGIRRNIEVNVAYDGFTASDTASYQPCAAPLIERTAATIALSDVAWAQGTAFTIEAYVTDNITPFVQTVTLYYRTTGTAAFTAAPMNLVGTDLYQAVIPSGAVITPGLDYYLSATDGQSTASDPVTQPTINPYQIAILPNVAPVIVHVPITSLSPGVAITVGAEITDNTNSLTETSLYYRKIGDLLYDMVSMTNTSGSQFEGTIPDYMVTTDGIEYYLFAEDDFGVGSYSGTPGNPYQVLGELLDFSVLLNIYDACSNSINLTFGTAPTATDLFDTGLDQYAPPAPPSGAFDARFHITADDLLQDFRPTNSNKTFWDIEFRPASGCDPVTMTWDPAQLPADGSYFRLVDFYTDGTLVNVDMRNTDTFVDAMGYGHYKIVTQLSMQTCIDLVNGWNMVGISADLVDSTATNLFPNAIPPLYRFDGTYIPTDYLRLATGYWERNTVDETVCVDGYPVSAVDINLKTGWNMIAGPSVPVAILDASDPGSVIIQGTLYGFSGAYIVADSLKPGHGYWLRATTDGTISLEYNSPKASANQFAKLPDLSNSTIINITDNAGNSQELYLDVVLGESALLEQFSMPPLPPAGLFDARFDGDFRISTTDEACVLIQSMAYPVQVSLTAGSNSATEYLVKEMTGESLVSSQILTDGSSIVIRNPQSNKLLISHFEEIPARFEVTQNYPNPFNPTTSIDYSIPEAGNVSVAIYNSLGQRIRSLVNKEQEAGHYSVAWDGRSDTGELSGSGVYFIRVQSGLNAEIKKMILIK
jgi:hypothetical protein